MLSNTNDFSKTSSWDKNLISSQDNSAIYGVVKHNDYSYGVVQPPTTPSYEWNNDDRMWLNENNALLVDEPGKQQQVEKTYNSRDYSDNSISSWGTYGDTSDYPNNQAKPKVSVLW